MGPGLRCARRLSILLQLYDIDRTSWWLLLYFVPVIGWIVLIGFACLPGTLGPNRYGPDPFADVVRAASV